MSINKSFKNIDINYLKLKYSMFFEMEKTNKLIVHIKHNKGDIILDNTDRSYNFSSKSMPQLKRFYIFLTEGIKHILAGTDHLLFVLMLLIPSSILLYKSRHTPRDSAIKLLKIITAFSLAHSITLFISAMNIYRPDVTVIESSIALSIFFVALLNFLGKYSHVNYKISFIFGLIHGFGFANVLEIAGVNNLLSFLIALFGFNLGVELGQILVILLILPLLYILSQNKNFPYITKVISFLTIIISSVWFLQRVGLL